MCLLLTTCLLWVSVSHSPSPCLLSRFAWNVPHEFNIGVALCDQHCAASPDKVAIIYEHEPDASHHTLTFSQLTTLSNRLCNALQHSLGVARGDRIALLLPPGLECIVAHIAITKLGCIAVPLFTLFGSDAIQYRLNDSQAVCLLVDGGTHAEQVHSMITQHKLKHLRHVIVAPPLSVLQQASSNTTLHTTSSSSTSSHSLPPHFTFLSALLHAATCTFIAVRTLASDPALLIYTSGSTAEPKGTLHAHRVLLGHLPGFEFTHGYAPQPNDCIWTPADFAWIGGLLDVMMPALYYRIPLVVCRPRVFSADHTHYLIRKHRIRNAFLPPTALHLLRASSSSLSSNSSLSLRTIASGGEPLDASLIDWCKRQYGGAAVHEFYGQTECNMLIGNNTHAMACKPGSMGRAMPGTALLLFDTDSRTPVSAGEVGEIAVAMPHPTAMLEYWNNPQATSEKFITLDGHGGGGGGGGGAVSVGSAGRRYLVMGDMARMDDEGYVFFLGRSDDVIKSSGYRIAPHEIEQCLAHHPAVASCAVIGLTDATRGTLIKAFIVPTQHYTHRAAAASGRGDGGGGSGDSLMLRALNEDEQLIGELQSLVKQRLAAYQYPKLIEFVGHLPTTTTGKIKRKHIKLQEESKRKQALVDHQPHA